jgi:PAS domain S-box-containing protein
MERSAATGILLDHTQDKIAVVDGDGTYEYVNAAAERILGYTDEELLGKNAFEFVHPDDVETVRERFNEAIESEAKHTDVVATYRHRARDGSWVWLESNMSNLTDSVLGGYIISSREVTDRVEAQRERRQTETRLRELANTTTDVLWMGNRDWTEVLFCNPAYEHIFGMPVAELEADPNRLLDAIHPEDRPAVEAAMERLSNGEQVDMEYRVNPTRGYDRWVWSQGEPITDDGEVVRIVGFVRDITHRRRRERQLAVMDNLLRHNLRNQMNAILGHADLIEETASDETSEMVAVIRRASEKLLETADKQREIVEFLRRTTNPQPVDLSASVRDAVETMRERYPEGTIRDEVPADLTVTAVAEIDASVRELIENAIRHCGHGNPLVTVDARIESEEATLVVTDNCQPLPEYDHRVLTGHHEMDAVYHSSGCGLWLVYWTVDLSNGRVAYEYDADQGNVVRVTLPRA